MSLSFERVTDLSPTDLNEQCSVFRGAIAQVVSIYGQDAVAHTQLTVPSGQAPIQQVEDVDSMLIRSSHQLDTQLLVRRALVQDYVDAVIPDREVMHAVWRMAHRHLVPMWVAMRVGAVAVALFPEHCQPQELAGLLEGGHSVAVRDVADVDAVHLEKAALKMLGKSTRMSVDDMWVNLNVIGNTFKIMSPGSRRPSRAMTPSL